jgi:hypothetical protein
LSVEKLLVQRHLKDGVLVFYGVTSSYLEGRRCELAQFGYSRDQPPSSLSDLAPRLRPR